MRKRLPNAKCAAGAFTPAGPRWLRIQPGHRTPTLCSTAPTATCCAQPRRANGRLSQNATCRLIRNAGLAPSVVMVVVVVMMMMMMAMEHAANRPWDDVMVVMVIILRDPGSVGRRFSKARVVGLEGGDWIGNGIEKVPIAGRRSDFARL